MSNHSIIYVENTHIMRVDLLADEDGTYQNDATVTMESLTADADGTAVSGVTVPLTLSYVAASNGRYEGIIVAAAGLTSGAWYTAEIKAISSSGDEAVWQERLRAATRRD